jgi:hypothetical protein
MALAPACSPVNFWQASQTSVKDVGFAQYSSVYATDTRTLDPCPKGGGDYWAVLGATNSTSAAIQVTPASQNFGTLQVGTSAVRTFVVQNTGNGTLSGTASVSPPFSLVSGGTYNLSANQSQTVTVQYSPTAAASDAQTVNFTGASGAAPTVTGVATNALVVTDGAVATFAAGSGTLTAPFVLTNGFIYQPANTGVANGGKATYNFSITTGGTYVVDALINAPTVSHNSVYLNIDALPTDPTMIWDIDPTTGFEQRVASWRGSGADGSDEFVPQMFNLTPGAHQLIIIGCESNVQLQQISIVALPQAPSNLRIVSGH